MPQSRTRRAFIIAAIAVLWAADAALAAVGGHDSIRSITQGLAVTMTVLAGIARMRRREPRRVVAVSAPVAPAYAPTSMTVDSEQITMEIPRMRMPIPVRPTPDTVPNMPAALAGQLYRMGLTNARRGARIMRLL